MKPVHKLCKLKAWSTPASLYPDGKVGKARLKTAHYTRGHYLAAALKTPSLSARSSPAARRES